MHHAGEAAAADERTLCPDTGPVLGRIRYHMGFLTVLLLYRGFSNSQIGVVSFLALTLPIVVQPGLAALADRDGRFTSRRLGLALVCLAATAAGVMWAWGANRLLTAVLYVLIGVCLTATQPFSAPWLWSGRWPGQT